MSIINEALKKAGREKAQADGYKIDVGVEDARKNLNHEFRRRTDGANWGPLFILVVLVLVTAPLVAPTVGGWMRQWPSSTSSVELASAPASTKQAQFTIEEAPLFSPAASVPTFVARSGFNVSGVMVSPSGSYGIINDQVVRPGERIDGAKLVEITPDKVVLEIDGQMKEIPVRE